MSTQNTAQEDRARLSLDFDDDEEDMQAKEAMNRKIEKISEESGFVARAPSRAPAGLPKPAPGGTEAAPARVKRRRAKTGRTYPFNTKIKPETYDEICLLADTATEEEGRPVSLAEIIERAVEALKAK